MRRNPKYKFLLNKNPERLEIHDLHNEKKGPQECQIDEIQNYSHLTQTDDKAPDRWIDQNSEYDGCAYCLNRLHTK